MPELVPPRQERSADDGGIHWDKQRGPRRWPLPYQRPGCPACGTPLRMGSNAPRPHPQHGPLVRLVCPNRACPSPRRSHLYTRSSPPRLVTLDLRQPKPTLPGREAIRCPACQHPMIVSRTESHPDRDCYVFKCNTAGCRQWRRRQWWQLREGRLPERLDPALIRRRGPGRNQPKLPVPERVRPCGKCGRWRPGGRYTVGGREVFRLVCRRCKTAEVVSRDGKPVSVSAGRWKYPRIGRPRCPACGRPKVVSGRLTLAGFGAVLRYICSPRRRTPDCPPDPEFRTEEGNRPVDVEEVRRRRQETNFKTTVPIPGFDRRERTRCPACNRPMAYAGVVRQGTACRFYCNRGHRVRSRFFDKRTGAELSAERPLKPLPFQRPKCPECSVILGSAGQYSDGDTGQALYRLVCRNPACSARDLYFNERGELVREPRRVVRRPRLRGSLPRPGQKRWCAACGVRVVSEPHDPRVRYCPECQRSLPPWKLWEKAQAKRYGPREWKQMKRLRRASAVRRARAERHWTQAELAERAGLSLALVKKIEQGSVPLTKRSQGRMAHAFSSATL